MTERVCPTCMGEGVVEDEDEVLEEDLNEETGLVECRLVTTLINRPCPTCGGEGSVEE